MLIYQRNVDKPLTYLLELECLYYTGWLKK